MNAFGKVPVFVEYRSDGNFVPTQSNAITLPAAERSGSQLLPFDPVARARVYERFFHFLMSGNTFLLDDIAASTNASAFGGCITRTHALVSGSRPAVVHGLKAFE